MTRRFFARLRTRPDTSSYALFARACRQAKGRNLIDELLAPFRLAVEEPDSDPALAAAVRKFQVRPFYTPKELATLWPLISCGICGKRNRLSPSPAYLRQRLIDEKLPLVRRETGLTFFLHNGVYSEFFAVENPAQWARVSLTQERFRDLMAS